MKNDEMQQENQTVETQNETNTSNETNECEILTPVEDDLEEIKEEEKEDPKGTTVGSKGEDIRPGNKPEQNPKKCN